MNPTATGGGFLSGLTSNTTFWEVAFIVALLLLIGAHKLTVEGMIEA